MENQTKINKVIFICAENAGRSKMAEAFFNKVAQKNNLSWIAESAGTFPAHNINPTVIQAMNEIGIIIEDTQPKLFFPDKASEYARLISFGCIVKKAFSKKIQLRIEEWHIEDPKDKPIDEVRKIRNEIIHCVNKLINNL